MKIDDLFTVSNGLATTGLTVYPTNVGDCIPLLRPASTQLRTVAGWVKRSSIPPKKIFPAESLIVSTNGEGSHSFSYVTSFEFTCNSDVSVLTPKSDMTLEAKVFYARAITMNRPLFSYGRKPKGKRLKAVVLPDLPSFLADSERNNFTFSCVNNLVASEDAEPKEKSEELELVSLDTIFEISYGNSLELNKLTKSSDGVNYISRTEKNNGVSARVSIIDDIAPTLPPALTCAAGGSVLETFLQKEPFYSGYHLFCLKPKVKLTDEELLFYASCIRANKWKYSYGRQANRTLKELQVPSLNSIPDWVYGGLKLVAEKLDLLSVSADTETAAPEADEIVN